MSNSSLVSYAKISPNKNSPRNHIIDTITIHCVVGQCTVETLGSIFANPDRKASSNYGIGADGRIGLYVDEGDRSWCSSSASNDNRAITIEVASDTYHPYAVRDAAYNALIDLLEDICKRNNIKQLLWKADKNLVGQIDQQNMTAHRWFAAKACPGDWLYSRFGEIANLVNQRLEGDNEQMTQEQFNEYMKNYLTQLAESPETWGSDILAWGKENGLVKGDDLGRVMPNKFMTRLECLTMLKRLYEKVKKK